MQPFSSFRKLVSRRHILTRKVTSFLQLVLFPRSCGKVPHGIRLATKLFTQIIGPENVLHVLEYVAIRLPPGSHIHWKVTSVKGHIIDPPSWIPTGHNWSLISIHSSICLFLLHTPGASGNPPPGVGSEMNWLALSNSGP